MEIKFDVYFKKNLGTLFKHNEVDLDGIPAHTNLDLNLVDRLEVNYKVGTQKYTDSVGMVDIEERVIQIPFKSDVVKVGLNEFEIVAYMKNGDIKTSQTYTYNIDEAIGEGVVSGGSGDGHSHTNLAILNSITQEKIDNWDNKADSNHNHDEYANAIHTHNINEIEGLENIDIDLSSYYTKVETDNKISEEITKIELKEGPQGPQGIQGPQGAKGDKGEIGPEGPQGDKGDSFVFSDFTSEQLELLRGPQGPKGDKGYTGDRGPQGPQGIQGETGPQGPQGIQGAKGDKGEQGIQGIQGLKGNDGLTTSITINGTKYTHSNGNITLPTYPTLSSLGAEPKNSNIQAHIASIHAPSNAQKNSDITKAEIENKLTGNITTHTHSQYLTQHQDLSSYPKTNELSLGIHTDGMIYLFKNGQPIGNGVTQSTQSGDVIGYVDSENNIVLSGKLADGTYKLKYEMEDGSKIDVGQIDLSDKPAYTNQIPLSINSDGTPFNGGQGWKTGYRISKSSGGEVALADYECIGFIPVTKDSKIRIKGIEFTSADESSAVSGYDKSFTKLNTGNGVTLGAMIESTDDNGVSTFKGFGVFTHFATTELAYIRLSSIHIDENSIITVDEPIV